MTARGRSVLVLGLVVYAASWVFGSRPLAPVAVGLVLAVPLARLWVALADRPLRINRRRRERELLEGDEVEIELEVEPSGGIRPPVLTCIDRLGRLGPRQVELVRFGRALHGRYRLHGLPRGRHLLGPVELALEDPFGLARRERTAGDPSVLLVYPRLVEIDRLFGDGGALGDDGGRFPLRRESGFDMHGVREYEDGESLRRVHWPSTARRGRLMVKDFADPPRDEVVVALDAYPAAGSTFDLQVRAAGSVLGCYVRRGRRCVLVANGPAPLALTIRDGAGEWQSARDVLAAAEPGGRLRLAALLATEDGTGSRAKDLVVVTPLLEPALIERLVGRARSRRRTALVYVDASGRPEPALLRLQAAGVAIAVLREGDDLAAALAGGVAPEAAHA